MKDLLINYLQIPGGITITHEDAGISPSGNRFFSNKRHARALLVGILTGYFRVGEIKETQRKMLRCLEFSDIRSVSMSGYLMMHARLYSYTKPWPEDWTP